MTLIYDSVRRLESDPRGGDLARGFAAEVADPVWFLGRQWQLGEHAGEDASSPVRVSYRPRLTPIDPLVDQPGDDPRTTPAEAIVESEPGDHWTPGRRVAAGRLVASAVALPDEAALLLPVLPVPYDVLPSGGYDGRALWRRRSELGLDPTLFGPHAPPGDEPTDLWDPAELAYEASFTAGDRILALHRHDGGELDWYAVDADAALDASAVPADAHIRYPGRVRYPGAPLPRWWQIEDTKVDVGGYPPDRSHLATLLVIDLIVTHSDDWFSFPVAARAGHVVTLDDVVVTDSFGEHWPLAPPAGWSLFETSELGPRSLVVWSVAATPLVGPVLDEVTVGIDEDANLVWAVERRLDGRDLATPDAPLPAPPAELDAAGRPGFVYRPMTRVPPHWHPYPVEEVDGRRRFVQGRAADLSGATATLLPAASSDLLIDPAAVDPVTGPRHPVHQLEPAAIPNDGLRVERRAMLARRTDGSPVLWTQRRRQPLLSPPTLALRFDALEPVAPGA